jgi:hypothetical protein
MRKPPRALLSISILRLYLAEDDFDQRLVPVSIVARGCDSIASIVLEEQEHDL